MPPSIFFESATRDSLGHGIPILVGPNRYAMVTEDYQPAFTGVELATACALAATAVTEYVLFLSLTFAKVNCERPADIVRSAQVALEVTLSSGTYGTIRHDVLSTGCG